MDMHSKQTIQFEVKVRRTLSGGNLGVGTLFFFFLDDKCILIGTFGWKLPFILHWEPPFVNDRK